MISGQARAVIKGKKECFNCTYDKFVDVAHKKAISSFSPDDMLSVINHPNNLMYLCPNCHHEFDGNILSLNDIEKNHTKLVASWGIEPQI